MERQKTLPLHKGKQVFLFLVIITLLLSVAEINYDKIMNFLTNIKILNIKIFIWAASLIFVIFMSFVLHYIAYNKTTKEIEGLKKLKLKSIIDLPSLSSLAVNFHKIILTPDYLFAAYFKKLLIESIEKCPKRILPSEEHLYNESIVCECYECEEHLKKKSRKLFILLSNWLNIILVCALVILTVFWGQYLTKGNLFALFFAFLVIRTLSRGIEIVSAFYKDVVVSRMTPTLEFGEKLSSLKRGNRISLAVHSYLEMTLIYGIIYFIQSQSKGSLMDSILYSFSVTALNYSFNIKEFSTFEKMLHISQIFIGITLVVLSIASYLGIKDKMSPYEESDWKKNKYI